VVRSRARTPINGRNSRGEAASRFYYPIKNELKVVLIEDKRKGLESQGSMWRDAVEQLAGYMRLVPADQGATILYGAVVIGTYIRSYYLGRHWGITRPEKQASHTTSDEKEIDRILNEYVEITSPE
jgi:hypothetical protein